MVGLTAQLAAAGLALDAIVTESGIAASPNLARIPVAIVLEGADDGVDPPSDPAKTAPHFTRLRRQTVLKGVGHNLPQEAPDLFADAVLELGQ